MANLEAEDFVALSSPGTSPVLRTDGFKRMATETPVSGEAYDMPKRIALPSIDTSSSVIRAEDTGALLRSASAAVADALGIDASELPGSFYGPHRPHSGSACSTYSSSSEPQRPHSIQRSRRKGSVSSLSIYTPSVDIKWQGSIGESIEKRLTMAVADVLGLDDRTLPLDESFMDLGGNHRTARELRANCISAGLSIKTKDIMNCKTIAELETCVTPISPPQSNENPMPPMIVSPLESSTSDAYSHRSRRRTSERRRVPSIPPKAAARSNAVAHLRPRPSRKRHNEAEKVISSYSDISRACVLKPKAGFFEGRIVAFITLTSCIVEGPDDCEVKLQSVYYTNQLPAIRKAIESQVSPTLLPKLWIVLEKMPLDEHGKIDRRKLQTWIQNANEQLHREILATQSEETITQPTNAVERRIHKTASKVLQVDPTIIGMNKSFASLGGDQQTASELVLKCRSQGISLKVEDVMQTTSLTRLASLAMSTPMHSRNASEVTAEVFELSPMQRLYFHTAMGSNNPGCEIRNGEYRFNQSVLLRLKKNMSLEDVGAAVEALVGRHSMLRCRFRPSTGSWYQSIEPEISASFEFVHHSVSTDAEVADVVRVAQATIDVESGPTFVAHHFHTHDGCQMLYLVAHHLVVDLNSWRVIINDLEGLLTNGHLVSGGSLSFRDWVLHHRHRIQAMESASVLPFKIPARNYDYWGIDDASNTYGNTTAIGFTLSKGVTSKLEAGNENLKMDSSDVFMATLLLSFARTFRDRGAPTIWNQEHERPPLDTGQDVYETVGWFTSLCPLALDISPTDDILAVLGRVKELRQAIAERGVPYFATNLIDTESAKSFTSTHCPLEVIFINAGAIQNLESHDALLEQLPIPGRTLASETSDIGRSVGRIAVFEVSVSIDQGETKFKIIYHQNTRYQKEIHVWVRTYEKLLRQIIDKLQHKSPELSISDVAHMNLTSEGFGRLNNEILPHLNLDISNIEAIYPVTPNQQNILNNQSLIPGSSKAQIIYDLDTSGAPVDISHICAAWLQVSGNHTAMRTVFCQSVSDDGLYDQIILRCHSPTMLFLESDSIEDALTAIDNLPPLPLNDGVPWHRLVVCQALGHTFLKLEISLAICDVASMAILFSELEQAYFDGLAPSASEVSYPEYTQCLKATPCSMEFWREHLCGVQPCRFPTLLEKAPVPNEWETTSIDLKVSCKRLRRFANEYRVDIATVLRVAWGLLLRTYIGTDTVCFGYRTSGRDIPVQGLKDAVGSFSAILPCKLDIPSGQLLAQLLLDAEDQRRRAQYHQHVPVTRIEHELKIKGNHLFNTCLSFGYECVSDDSLGNTKCRHVRSEQASEFDLSTDVYFHDGSITVDIGCRILASDQATNVAYAFGRAIEAILDSPGGIVKEADLFSIHDHKQILAWNSMPQVEVPNEHVHKLIAKQALQNPEIQAVCAWDGDLSYAELHKSSMVLAKHLLAKGLKPQMPVPVIVDKSRWAVVSMLAVLHAGGVVVPVDAETHSMFSWVIKVVGAEFILVSDGVRRHVDGTASKIIVVCEQTITAMSAQDVDMTLPKSISYGIACILFSSGSSKSTKGISYSHGALATACVGQAATLMINPSSRVMQLSSYSVDIALTEVFTTLVSGGCVCVPSAAERVTGFAAAARRMSVNWTYLTPSLSRKLDPDSLPDLAVVCFRTRQLDADAYAPWAGKAKVLLVYGSAEACPLGLAATEVTDANATQCFGSPFCGNFWIVSAEDNNRLMPVGALGELVIGGPTLASVFDVNDPGAKSWVDKSAARAKSLLEKSGSRLLKTGHLVRYRERGEIEFVSARGEECEIDGRRFRLSDVEPKLRQCLGRGVDVVVETIAFNDANSPPILAAFVEFGESLFHGHVDMTKLSRVTRERLYLAKKMADMVLRESLPSHMVPSAYIPVKRMPLTPSLKVNRRDLQRMIAGLSRKQLLGLADVSNPQEMQAAEFKPLPLTEVEQQMRTIWAGVLGISDDSILGSDRFMSLGGDVVLAHDIIIECRQRGINIPIVDLLRDLSLTELCRGVATMGTPAASIREARSARQHLQNTLVNESIAPQISSNKSLIEDVAEASSLQTMCVESGMLQSQGNVNYFVINVSGSLDWNKLDHACCLLTKVHPMLRTAFVSHGRQLYQTVLRSYRPEFLRYQCQGWRLHNLATKLVKREQSLPIDFRKPVTKFSYLDAGKSSVLIIRLSLAQYDDFSIPVLVRDLSRFYSCSDRVTKSPGLCEVVRAARATYMNGASDYWRALLEGASMTQVISQSSPAGANVHSRTLHQQIPTGSLQNLGIPFETILKGAWSIVLCNLSGTNDVVFGQLVEGKHLSLPDGRAASDIVGPMGNIIPVRTRLPDIPITPYEYFRCVQSQHVASIPQENMQTLDIIQKCTTWPSWTRFSTVVYHQNQAKEDKPIGFSISNASCKLSCVESIHRDSDVFVKSVSAGSANVGISLTFCENKMQLIFADQVLKMLCSIISLLTSTFIMEPVLLKGLSDTYSTPRIPLPTPKRELSIASSVQSVDPDHARAVHTTISAAWDTILEAHSLKVPDIRSVPFYEVWGAVLPAAELARYYTENMPLIPGLERKAFTMEDIIEHPTMMQQYELIIARQQMNQLKRNRSFMLVRSPGVWGKGIRKPPAVASEAPEQGHHQRYPDNQKATGSSGHSSSPESMTTGSSQDDDDELRDDLMPLTTASRKKSVVRGTKRERNSILGKMIPMVSG
ncbi:hypothetical protein F4779DRAFT_618304 [Xylariaceae sp. FL0662B]|nr:hypothetical protein F4779DRAFT_618304 [Xylariaceae sp. FL0662B]